MPAMLLLGRCDPYGAETGGPRHVLGGLHGPRSAETPGAGLPDNVAQGEWLCTQPAAVRVMMTCRCGHYGKVMPLCSWHDEKVWSTEIVAGKPRRISRTVKVHGHYEEITKRMAGACPRCLYPKMHAEDHHSLLAWQEELAFLRDTRRERSPRADEVRGKIEEICARFDDGNRSGAIHRCPMTLIPVS